MIKKSVFLFVFSLFVFLLSAQNINTNSILTARALFQAEKYGIAQNLFHQIYNDNGALDSQKEEALFHIAICSKKLFNDDVIFWFDKFTSSYPYSEKINAANYDLALYYYREKSYDKAINYFLRSDNSNDEYNFKLAYSYFMTDSLSSSKYYFSKLLNVNSKYASSANYFYAHIAYKQKHYKTALSAFLKLKDDEHFANIVPYYVSQIYFLLKRHDELIAYAKPMLDRVISSREAELNRIIAEAYYNNKDYQSATEYFETYFAKTSQSSNLDKLLIGHAYHNIEDYENAIRYLEPLEFDADSSAQFTSYYLANSYLKLGEKNYALRSYKKASDYNYNSLLQEDAYFNYAKLSYELDLPFDNVLNILQYYLTTFEDPQNKKLINNLMISAFQNTSRYEQAFEKLNKIVYPSQEQKMAIQRLSFFIGVKAFNIAEYNEAISLFENANKYRIDEAIFAMSTYWLADCYFQLSGFSKSAKLYNDYLALSLSSATDFAQYNLAYAYFQQKDYQKAKNSFRKFSKATKDSIRLNDTYLRIADCYFMLSDFSMAEKNYAKAISYNLFDGDYALYKQSVCLGLVGKHTAKEKVLKQLIENHKTSIYHDDALLDLAVYYKNNNQKEKAFDVYNQLLDFTLDEELKAKVHLNKGMIYFNFGDIDKAITSFMVVINNFSKTSFFKDALAGLRAAYISIAEVDKYLEIVNALPQVNISRVEQDSLTYNTAFMKFAEGDYLVAKNTFQQYITNFSNGIFVVDANYYLAESCKKEKDTSCVLSAFDEVINAKSKHLEPANLYLARHYYALSDFEKSVTYYKKVEIIATNNSTKREALIRLMIAYSKIDKLTEDAVNYAKKVLQLDKVDQGLKNRANLILSQAFFASGNFQKSEKIFTELRENSETGIGAEAAYMLAYLNFLNDSLQRAENAIYSLANDFTADYWIAKGFILLSDIYAQKGNAFQAKATLESIIENYEGEELLIVARKKFEAILQKDIAGTSATTKDQAEIVLEILDEEINYEMFFEEESDTNEIPKIIKNEK
ncbi:MAG: tetratricopeptide repeat protein [Bacteroidota bacterium]|nr:tetratricopeptide repeat protein [Bacteroidota bacterium]